MSEEKPIVGEKAESEKKKDRTLKEYCSDFIKEGREWKLTPRSFFFSFAWLGILLLLVDLLSKWLVQLNVRPGSAGGEIWVIPDFFSIYLTYNQGSAFGMGGGSMAMRVIFILVSWIASILIPLFHWHYLRKNDPWINAVFALCFAGAAGNLIDRTFYWNETVGFSGVIDFFCFYIFGPNEPPFAIFNVADACLSVGIVLLIVIYIVRFVIEARAKNGK